MAVISQIKGTDNVIYNVRDDVNVWGGRNLLKKTDVMIFASDDWSPWCTPKANVSNYCLGAFSGLYFPQDTQIGDIFTFSYEIEWTKFTPGTGGTYSAPWLQWYANGSWSSGISWPVVRSNVNTVTTAESTTNAGTKKIILPCIITTAGQITANWYGNFRTDYSDGTGKFRVRRFKLEKGTKPTDWSPAPEDIAHVNGEQLELLS